jgi:hypothetical protein
MDPRGRCAIFNAGKELGPFVDTALSVEPARTIQPRHGCERRRRRHDGRREVLTPFLRVPPVQATGADETIGRDVAEAGHSHSVRVSPVDGCLDEVGREEGERDRHVHLPQATALTSGDAFGIRSEVGNEFVEPTAPACNRCDGDCAVLGTDGPGISRPSGFGHENFTATG